MAGSHPAHHFETKSAPPTISAGESVGNPVIPAGHDVALSPSTEFSIESGLGFLILAKESLTDQGLYIADKTGRYGDVAPGDLVLNHYFRFLGEEIPEADSGRDTRTSLLERMLQLDASCAAFTSNVPMHEDGKPQDLRNLFVLERNRALDLVRGSARDIAVRLNGNEYTFSVEQGIVEAHRQLLLAEKKLYIGNISVHLFARAAGETGEKTKSVEVTPDERVRNLQRESTLTLRDMPREHFRATRAGSTEGPIKYPPVPKTYTGSKYS